MADLACMGSKKKSKKVEKERKNDEDEDKYQIRGML